MIAAMITVRTLDNGLRVVVEEVPAVRSVAVGVWVDCGSRDEVPGTHGASHFLEHLLFKGTDTRSAEDIARSLDAVGGEFNAYTTKETTVFHVRTLDDDIGLGLDVLADITQRPAMRPDEVEAERNVVLEEINMYEDSPDELVHDIFCERFLSDHELGRPVIGTRSSITEMARDDIMGHFSRWYGADRIVVAVAGSVDVDAAVAEVERRWGAMPSAAGRRGLTAPASPGRSGIEVRDTEQVHLVLGSPTFDRADERRYALSLLNHIFGGGMSSRLFQEIREKRGLTYSVYSYRSLFQETGYFAAYAGCAPDRVAETLEVLNAEWDRAAEGVTDVELANAKGHLRAQMAMSQEDTASRMGRIGRALLTLGEVITVDDVVSRIDAVTRSDVDAVAAEVFRAPRTLVVLGPDDGGSLSEAVA